MTTLEDLDAFINTHVQHEARGALIARGTVRHRRLDGALILPGDGASRCGK
jgi:hypothetical protein